MRCLELFKGTGSVSKILEPAGHEIISLDILERFDPTHCCDILDFDYEQYPRGHFQVIWASPECKVFSRLQQTNIGPNRKWKDWDALNEVRRANSKYVEKVLEIIEYFQPGEWYIENPWSSAMKDLPCMQNLKSYRFDYCQFGYGYKKPTRIWTNREDMEDHPCTCAGVHKFQIGNYFGAGRRSAGHHGADEANNDKSKRDERYRIPEDLLRYLFAKHLKK